MMESEETRAGLLQAVEIAVKDLERIFCGFELTTKVWQVRYLCEQLDRILLYGLRIPLYGYWPFVKEFSHEETTREIIALPRVNSNLGYGRAWLLGALQSGLVVCYFQSFVYNRKLVHKYYLDNSLLRDTIRLKVTIHYLARLSNLKFAFVTNDSTLDQTSFFSPTKDSPALLLSSSDAAYLRVNGCGVTVLENNNISVKTEPHQHSPVDGLTVSSLNASLPVNGHQPLSCVGIRHGDEYILSPGGCGVPTSVSPQPDSFGPDSLERAIEMDEQLTLQEIEVSGADRFDIAQLLAKEPLLNFVKELCEEDDESFYKVFLCYYYRVEQQHLSLVFLVLTTQRLLLLKTIDGFSLTQVASLPLLHIRQLRLAMDQQALEIVWTSPREVFRSPAYAPAGETGSCGSATLQLVTLCAEQCSWVVGHLELAIRRLGVHDQALPFIRQGCRPVTVIFKDWTRVKHVLWASCERFPSRSLYERHATLSRLIVSRLFYRLVPRRASRNIESTILWRSARFELKAATLEQYDLESDVTPTAVYNLAEASCSGVQLCVENPRPFSFRVMWTTEPTLELAAESEFEFSEWLHSLLRSYKKYRSQTNSGSQSVSSSSHVQLTGASLCSIVLEENRLLICYGPSEVRESIGFGDIVSLAAYHNSFLAECRPPSTVEATTLLNSAKSKRDGRQQNDEAQFTWLISFYGEAEAQLFLEHLKHSHASVSCRLVRDSTTQGILCEPREKTFNQMCSYAAKFCDIIAAAD